MSLATTSLATSSGATENRGQRDELQHGVELRVSGAGRARVSGLDEAARGRRTRRACRARARARAQKGRARVGREDRRGRRGRGGARRPTGLAAMTRVVVRRQLLVDRLAARLDGREVEVRREEVAREDAAVGDRLGRSPTTAAASRTIGISLPSSSTNVSVERGERVALARLAAQRVPCARAERERET